MAKITIGDYSIVISREGVKVGCTFVPRKTLEQILAAIKKAKLMPKLRVGTKVKVIGNISDSSCVLGRTGRVVIPNDDGQVLVRFIGWTGGHSGADNDQSVDKWYVDPATLQVVK